MKKLLCIALGILFSVIFINPVVAFSPTKNPWSGYSYVNASYETPAGKVVNCRRYTQELSQAEIDAAYNSDAAFLGKVGLSWSVVCKPTLRFNCYSYALYSTNYQTNQYVVDNTADEFMNEGPLYAYFTDPHFTKVPNYRAGSNDSANIANVGDVVFYFKSKTDMVILHAGVVSQIDSNGKPTMVISKWGPSGLYEHAPTAIPRDYLGMEGVSLASRELYYETYSFTRNHSYTNWTKVSATTHKGTCKISGCPSTKTEAHGYGPTTYNSSNHSKTCQKCSYVSSQAHSYTCTNTGSSTTHKLSCACGYSKTESHGMSWSSTSDTKHKGTCSKCSYSTTGNHTFGAWTSSGTSGHSHRCSVCSKVITAAHIYNGTQCTVCGYTGPGVAPIIIPKAIWKSLLLHD